jgi:hypothetical protein
MPGGPQSVLRTARLSGGHLAEERRHCWNDLMSLTFLDSENSSHTDDDSLPVAAG